MLNILIANNQSPETPLYQGEYTWSVALLKLLEILNSYMKKSGNVSAQIVWLLSH